MRLQSLILVTLLATPIAAQNPAWKVEELITADSLASSIEFLSHDLLEGRGVGSRGDELTRLYLRTQFRQFGLEPAGPGGAWDQPVPIVGIKANLSRPLSVRGPKATFALGPPQDYTLEAGRPTETTEWKDAEVVFVGYGIDAPEEKWDDFKGADLRGKVLLVMNNDPSTDPELFAGKTRLYYGRWSYKFEEAARRGAVGAIVIHTTPSAGYPFQVIQSGHGKEEFWLPFAKDTPTLALRSWCSEDAAKRIAAAGGHDLDRLRAQAESREFKPVPLGVTVDVGTTNRVREIPSANVLARLPGSDPVLKDQHIVVSAHFDHLGRGRPVKGDDIYNGALDNASGCGALLDLARALSALETRPRRTIIFAAVTAEESGLLGSLYYARNPTVPVKSIVANFNIDGINIYGRTRDLGMIGHGKNSLTDLAVKVATRRGRTIVPDKEVDKGYFYRSDHFSFARVGVPAAYFKAGNDFVEEREKRRRVKLAYTGTHYHQPSDQYDSRWNLEGAVEDTRLILECLLRCAQDDAVPTWTPGDEFEKLR